MPIIDLVALFYSVVVSSDASGMPERLPVITPVSGPGTVSLRSNPVSILLPINGIAQWD